MRIETKTKQTEEKKISRRKMLPKNLFRISFFFCRLLLKLSIFQWSLPIFPTEIDSRYYISRLFLRDHFF